MPFNTELTRRLGIQGQSGDTLRCWAQQALPECPEPRWLTRSSAGRPGRNAGRRLLVCETDRKERGLMRASILACWLCAAGQRCLECGRPGHHHGPDLPPARGPARGNPPV
jgi:hypothetical protein